MHSECKENALCKNNCGLVCKRLIYNALCERECGLECKRLIYNALCERMHSAKEKLACG